MTAVHVGLNRFRQKIICLAMMFACYLSTAESSRQSAYNSRLWQTDDGLPQNSVQAIVQTRDGYLWLGTQDGLARFDGLHFTVFSPKNVPELAGRVITVLSESKDGSLWIGTDAGGLTRLKGGTFSHYGKTTGLGSDGVRAICETADGSLWIGTSEGLVQFKDEQFTIVPREGLATSVRALCEDLDGQLWIGTGSGVDRLKNGKLTNFQKTPWLLHSSVRELCRDHDGAIWIATDGGLTRFRNGDFSHFTKNEGLDANFFSSVYQDHVGTMWVGTPGGLQRFDGRRWTAELTANGTPYDPVYAIYEDRENDLWVGTKTGLYKLTPRRFACYTTAQGLSHNETASVLEDSNGDIWIGTRGGGLNRIHDGKITWTTTTNGLSSELVLALCEDTDGSLLIGTDFLGGLNRLNDGRVTCFQRDMRLNSAILVICRNHRGSVWVGTRNGLWRLQNGEFSRFGKIDVKNSTVRTLYEDHAGTLWIGTDRGLSSWDGDRFRTFTHDDGLPHAPVFSIHEDENHLLWLATRGGGISRFDGKTFVNYTTTQGLPSDNIFEILEDDRGWLWMSSPKGISRIAKTEFEKLEHGESKTLSCIAYGKEDGMITSECIGIAKPAGFKTRSGKLWFTTAKGVVCVDPAMTLNQNVPPITIEQLLSDRKPIPITDKAEIKPGRGEFEIHYSALSFQAPEKNRFRYKLEGVDADWIEAGTRRIAYYNNVQPGHYVFRVLGCNNDGVWNNRGASLSVVVLPHPWQTWWFKSTSIACIGAIALAFYRIRRTRRRDIEQLRIRIAADLHDEIGANLASIALLSQMESASHPEKGELSEIYRIALGTANSIREIVWFINPDYDTLPEMISRMKDAAITLLTGIEHRFRAPEDLSSTKLSLEFRRNVFLVFKEVLHNIAKHSAATCVQIEVTEERGQFSLRISDNGSGFDTKTVRRGNGLKNMRLRLAQLKGRVEIESSSGQGTTIRIYAALT